MQICKYCGESYGLPDRPEEHDRDECSYIIRIKERERCAKIAENTRIIGGETPGPLYVAGWNAACPQAAAWIRDDSFPKSETKT